MKERVMKTPKQKRGPYMEHCQMKCEGTFTVWIKFRAKDGCDAVNRFGEMSDAALLRLIKQGTEVRIKSISSALWTDLVVPEPRKRKEVR